VESSRLYFIFWQRHATFIDELNCCIRPPHATETNSFQCPIAWLVQAMTIKNNFSSFPGPAGCGAHVPRMIFSAPALSAAKGIFFSSCTPWKISSLVYKQTTPPFRLWACCCCHITLRPHIPYPLWKIGEREHLGCNDSTRRKSFHARLIEKMHQRLKPEGNNV